MLSFNGLTQNSLDASISGLGHLQFCAAAPSMQKRVWTEPTHVAQHKSRDGLTLAFDSISSDLNTEAKHCRMQNAASSYIWARRGSLRFEYENVISKFAV